MTTKRENLLPDYRLILLLLGFLALVYLLLPILTPFLASAILAYVCNPLVDKLAAVRVKSWQLGRTLGAVLVMLLLFVILIAAVLIVVPLLQKEILLMIQRMPNYVAALKTHLEPWLLKHFGIALQVDMAQLQAIVTEYWKTIGNYAGNALLSLSGHGLALVSALASLLIVPIVLFYLLRDWHVFIQRIAVLLPRRWLAKTTEIAEEMDGVLSEFLRGQLSVMLVMSAFYATGLAIAGLDLALPIGLISGLLGFVPYLGISTGMLLALLASALQFTSLNQLVPVIAVFGVGQLLESMLLTPWLVGDRIGLHPVVVIFVLLAGGQLFGFAGILLALPTGAAIAVGLKHLKRSYLASQYYNQSNT